MTEYTRRTRRISRILMGLVDESVRVKKHRYSDNATVDEFLRHRPFALLIGVIADQQVVASRAWTLPFLLSERLGHLNPYQIACMSERRLEAVIRRGGSLHRFPATMARWIRRAALLVCNLYGGQAENIWVHETSAEAITEKLLNFSGISQKKAAMFTKIVVRDEYADPKDLWSIDLPYDVHVRRVLLRTGLADKDTVESIVAAGKKMNPRYPGLLDDPIWLIGRLHCHASEPNHKTCPLRKVCPQLRKNATTG